jgi:CheY-like chemotaxis protein
LKTILIAEDNAVNRELLREALETRGYQVIEAVNGNEAVSQVDRYQPDLVLMDIQMPLLDGFGALQGIRNLSNSAGVQVFALTAYAMEADREKALAAGFDDYVTKPIEISSLARRIAAALEWIED